MSTHYERDAVSRVLEKHIIEDDLIIYLQANCMNWMAKFKVDGRWRVRSTTHCDKSKAITSAIRIKLEFDLKLQNGIAIVTKSFRDVAKLAIEQMRQLPKSAKGAASMLDYEQALKKYHIPFFDRTHITSIDYSKLEEFNYWRMKKLGRAPAQSTLKTHNAALQRVFDVAVREKWMSASKVPKLSTEGGVTGQRRDYFTPSEISRIDQFFPTWIAESRKDVTRQIRDALFFYFQVALHTGIRPGTEMDNLKWSDLHQTTDANGKSKFSITVRKGKTTLHTGTRHIPIHETVFDMILDYSYRFDEVKEDDFIFRLSNGKATDQLGKNFSMLLKRLKLEETPMGKRSLYSLRHTHITLQLLADPPISPAIIAKHCGTSPEMIQRHYSHVTPMMFAKELTENENGELNKLIKKYTDVNSAR